MNLHLMPEQLDQLRAIPLPSVLLATGAKQDKADRTKWHTSLGMISVTGCKFFNWNRVTGGGGAIDLVIHLYGLDFKSAVAWLHSHFSSYVPELSPFAVRKPNLRLPMPDPRRLSSVERYLSVKRCIPLAQIHRLIRLGDLYADYHSNAVFVLRTANHVPVGAELRGSGSRPWRGMAPGSRKRLGFFSVRHTNVDGIILCESAIDALSCSTIYPHLWSISTAGANPTPAWLPTIICHRISVYCGFDADPTGDAMAKAMINIYPRIKRFRPPEHDWNDVLASKS